MVGGHGCIAISGLAAGQRKMQGWITILIAAIALLMAISSGSRLISGRYRPFREFLGHPSKRSERSKKQRAGGIARPRRPQPLIRRFFLPHTHRLTRRRPGMAIIKFAIVVREAHTCASPTGLLWALVAERPVALPPVC